MQISKSFLVACLAAYCLALLPLHAADADTERKLREALEQKLKELETQPAQQPPSPVAKPSVTAPSAQQSPPVLQSAPAPTPAPAAAAAKPKPAKAKPQETASKPVAPKSQETASKPVAPKSQDATSKPIAPKSQDAVSKPQAKPQAENDSKKPAVGAGAKTLTPIEVPPSSLPVEKQQRLAELLRKYKAEEITPEEYHQQRAKILSEP